MVAPPLIIAYFVFELGVILEVVGVFVLALSGIFIPLASIAAQKLVPEKSEFDLRNNYASALSIIIISVILAVMSIVFIFI